MHGYRRPQPRTRKERRANGLGLDQMVTVEYGNRLVQIERPRAQGHRPTPDVDTGTRAFNEPAAFSPNPSVTGSVIGNKHPSNRSFCSLAHQTSQSMAGRSKVVRTSRQDPPRDAQSQRSAQQGLVRHLTLEQACSFPKKGRTTKDGTSTTLTQLPPRRTSVQRISQSKTAHRSRIQGHA